MTLLGDLKEIKLPNCVRGTKCSECKSKFQTAARTRGRAIEVCEGRVKTEVENHHNNTATLNAADLQVLHNENNRAFTDLLQVLPSGAIACASESKSDCFQNSCGCTAFEEAMRKTKEWTDREEEDPQWPSLTTSEG